MKILITGHRGMVGSALVREAQRRGGCEILTAGREALDLCDQAAVFRFLRSARPDIVVVAAAKVGGIHANAAYPAEFLYQNLAIASNLVHGSWQAGVGRLLFLGSSCIYPKLAPQPMPEDCLLASPLEPTNEAYAVAKIAGLKLCQHYRRQYGVCYHSAMPTNLYGPGDNYHPENSHVLPALIRRFHEAKEQGQPAVTVWAREPRVASSSTSTTLPTPASTCSAWPIRRTGSMSGWARMSPSSSWPVWWRQPSATRDR